MCGRSDRFAASRSGTAYAPFMPVPQFRLFGGLALMAIVGAAVSGFLVGHHTATEADWHTVTIEQGDVVSSGNGHRLLTVNVDGWAYGMENQVEWWLDGSGTLHGTGWPACLEPVRPGAGPDANPGKVTFRFAAADVSTKTIDWRPVVMVDCRG